MKKLDAMHIKLKMDRPIDPNLHCISPGGYEINGKKFDFFTSSGGVALNSDEVEFNLYDFDGTLEGEDKNVIITPEDLSGEFNEFYVYTGEYNDPEINVEKVLEVIFAFRDEATGETKKIVADERLLENINSLKK